MARHFSVQEVDLYRARIHDAGCGSCLAASAFGLMQAGDVGAALVFRHLDERYLAGRHYSPLRLGGEISGTAGAQIDAHPFAPMSEQIGAQLE